MTEYIPAMPPCVIRPHGTSDSIPVLLWKVTALGPKPMVARADGGLQVFEGQHKVERDYYSITEDANS